MQGVGPVVQLEDNRLDCGTGRSRTPRRGIAHVGVIRWLEEHRIPIDVAAGTSMGGLVGGAFATGMDAAELEAFISAIDWDRAVRRLVVRLQEHPPQGRRARLSVAPRVRAQGGIVPPTALNNGQQVELLLGAHRRALLRRRGLRRAADAVSTVAVDLCRRSPVVMRAARWPTRCAPRCRCR